MLWQILKVSSFNIEEVEIWWKKEIAHLYNPLCSTRGQTSMKSRIFELVKIFLQDSAYTFPSYCITLLCVCYTHVKSRGSFSSRLFHAPLPLSLSPLSTAVAVGTFLEKKRSVKIARILRFFSFLKNCDFHYRKSTAYQTPTIIYQNVNSH